MECWICGESADTGEHLVKVSDLKSVFGKVTQANPLRMHSEAERNVPVKGYRAQFLKSDAKICAHCNNERTQPHDKAWEKLSTFLRARERVLRTGEKIKLSKVFPGSVKKSMLYVHLYFVKLFGCYIEESGTPISLNSFSKAILNNRPHPNIFLAICPPIPGVRSVGRSDIQALESRGRAEVAVWFYILDKFKMRVIYSESSKKLKGVSDSWHPDTVSKRISVSE